MEGTTPSPETRYPIDAENVAEMARLTRQARIFTSTMGLLPPGVQLRSGQCILDLGSGPGEWSLELARSQRSIEIVGIDISEVMTQYAQSIAKEEGLQHLHFCTMNATGPLSFPNASFDLIHARLIGGFLSPTLWPALLKECIRVLKPGGLLVGTEIDDMGSSNSPSLTRLVSLAMRAFHQTGYCFTAEGDHNGLVAVYPSLLKEAGFSAIRHEAFLFNYSFGESTHQESVLDWSIAFRLLIPFLARVTGETEQALEALRQRAIEEMQSPQFCACSFVARFWASKA
ncbi:class I SAM-dependent methyltransferase [Ktedonosporobacter rubrisoli]|uniref:Class I SAM-dependent methyltransferase n=1 Tax=Ktedonosporobacter rubrisoli TaxID=2509675 RepID=A0A4V0YYD4_KTERU|nr:class I SAM-dependent methyltransferase [Ktedonosporobacter rubrisoli]QBD75831.1 class I SAM-dependent methyltransferase [Ktedonosporobacter rubrisoli]